jgi:HEPN family protein
VPLSPRGEANGFAQRTLKNLEFIESAFKNGEDVHVVTQLTLSLLGLIVYPWEKTFDDQIRTLQLDELEKTGWPRWQVLKGTCDTLGTLIGHLRNAAAHRRVTFSSDSRYLNEVAITFDDHKRGKPEPYWSARIGAEQLYLFCRRFIDLVFNIFD